MDNITLNPGISKLDAFKDFYMFLTEQILDEIGRKKKIRIISQDTSPIKIETELSDIITEIFQRFEVYEYPTIVGYGQFITTSEIDDENAFSIIDKYVFNKYPYPVEIELIDYYDGQIKVCSKDKNIAINKLETIDIIGGEFEENKAKLNTILHHPPKSEFKFDSIIHDTANKYKPKFMQETSIIEYKQFIYAIKKHISSIQEFADININSTTIAEMLMGDLIDKAIEIESSAK